MRGAHQPLNNPFLIGGIIPADAGSTFLLVNHPSVPRDHPRGCGEHPKPALIPRPKPGSSPRMRGAPTSEHTSSWIVRIIPADAGSTTPLGLDAVKPWDHPRGCGEHNESCTTRSQSGGSSPRMRGTHTAQRPAVPALRIIPADAGNTYSSTTSSPCITDHPRGCGEHSRSAPWLMMFWGSSPRMRGTPLPPHLDPFDGGIIPADAGNTCPPALTISCFWDHPRGCGEHGYVDILSSAVLGSSPRMRGTLAAHHPHHRRAGIIPADAGNTARKQEKGEAHQDHPRGCGEH